MTITDPMRQLLARAFEEWERRWRDEPEQFMADVERLASDATTIGQKQAAYLLHMVDEVVAADERRDRERLEETRVGRPEGPGPYPPQFFLHVASSYRTRVALGLDPGKRIAEDAGVPVSTAHRWIRVARQRGLLGPTVQGRVGGV